MVERTHTHGGTYTRWDLYKVGLIHGGTYTRWDLHTEGTYTRRDIHREGI